jgi:hypothetical protein
VVKQHVAPAYAYQRVRFVHVPEPSYMEYQTRTYWEANEGGG